MPLQRQDRVSLFKEAPMQEVESPSLTSGSSYSVRTEKSVKAPSFNYKPLVLRSYSLLSLLAVTLALIGLLEYAAVRLPHGTTHFGPQNVTISNSRRAVEYVFPRNATAAAESGSTATSSFTSTSTPLSTTTFTSSTITTFTTDTTLPSTISTPSSFPTSTTAPEPVSSTPTSTLLSTTEDDSSALTTTSPSSTNVPPSTTTPPTTTSAATSTTTSSLPSIAPTTAVVTATSAYLPTVQTITSTSSEAHIVQTNAKSAYVPTATPISTSSGNNGTSNAGNATQSYNKQEDRKQPKYRIWDAGETFLGTYMGVLIAVIYRMVWTIVYNNFNLIEPFRQLMRADGALAEQSFFAFYQSPSNFLGPIPALIRRRWAFALVATTYMIACFLPALASESIFVDTNWKCPDFNSNNSNNPCPPRTTVNVGVLRVLQAFLAIAAAVILFITSLILFRNTGLPADPRSMATIASLMRHPTLIEDLNHVPVNASSQDMQRVLQGKMYRLGSFRCANGENAYGIRPADGSVDVNHAILSTTDAHKYTPVEGFSPFSDRGSSALRGRFRIQDLILALVVLGSFGVVLAYYLDGNNDGFNRFFESNTFGPRFILTLAGTLTATLWKSVEQSSIVTAPYIRLAKQPYSSSSTILFEPSSTPVSSTYKAIRHRYNAVAVITVVTLLAEGLNIVIAGVPYATGETWMQFSVSAYMSIAILGIMIIVVAFVIFSRTYEPRMPRTPGTLGAVMSYISGSRMLDDFQGTEVLDVWTRNRMIRQRGKKYEFKETVRKDGKYAWTVDETPGPPMYHS